MDQKEWRYVKIQKDCGFIVVVFVFQEQPFRGYGLQGWLYLMAVPQPLLIAIHLVPAQLAGNTHHHFPVQLSKISDLIATESPRERLHQAFLN